MPQGVRHWKKFENHCFKGLMHPCQIAEMYMFLSKKGSVHYIITVYLWVT